MTSLGCKGKEPFSFMSKNPHFFKIILHNALLDQKLMIPTKFVRNHGDRLQNQALLKVPSGETWKVELKKCDGKVWLEEGWKEFADNYSVALGHFLVFEYTGSSDFHVLIFDNTATEIDYSLSSRRTDRELPPQDGEYSDSEDDKSVEILDDCSFFKKKRTRSPLSSPCPRKITKTVSTRKTSEGKRGVGRMHQLTNSEKAIAVKRTSSFKSKNPFCKVVMQPYFFGKDFRLVIPAAFARKCFRRKEGNVTFNGPQGRTWSGSYCFNKQARISTGWREFAQNNYLQIGDVCVFELINSKEIVFNVVIFRATKKNLKNHQLQGGVRISAKGDESKRCLNFDTPRRVKPLTAIEKANAFKSDDPFFSIVMQPSYVQRGFTMPIPYKFAKSYIKKKRGQAILRASDGRAWSVNYRFDVFNGCSKAYFYSAAFTKDNNLEVGDVCIFVLIKGIEISLQVFIFRCNDEASCSQFMSE